MSKMRALPLDQAIRELAADMGTMDPDRDCHFSIMMKVDADGPKLLINGALDYPFVVNAIGTLTAIADPTLDVCECKQCRSAKEEFEQFRALARKLFPKLAEHARSKMQ